MTARFFSIAELRHYPVSSNTHRCLKTAKLSGFGAAYGTAKSGVGIASMGVMRPELVMKSIVPVVMAGVLGIYGLIIAVIISTGSKYVQRQFTSTSCLCPHPADNLYLAGGHSMFALCCSQPEYSNTILLV